MSWARTQSLRGGMLFLGMNTSMWLANSQGWQGCKEDSMYFTDDYYGWHIFRPLNYVDEPVVFYLEFGYDLGVFRLKDGAIESIFDDRGMMYPYMVWVVPNP
ncbi:hypothetical protein QJS04_geneDACA011664 [Acorus gramineus]|uniref:KIB1-4 beta-propeller domain-containing protein n=1 Tax=Acorus gramineus TaxID=55184 RepID=A0AAV9BKJ1_ACOGR|nr:hypothetical protein QJS04_geneDACA011664 [Acorus gramineus]